jgi:hypothetical protein
MKRPAHIPQDAKMFTDTELEELMQRAEGRSEVCVSTELYETLVFHIWELRRQMFDMQKAFSRFREDDE